LHRQYELNIMIFWMHHRVVRNVSTAVSEVPVYPTGQHLILEDGIINIGLFILL